MCKYNNRSNADVFGRAQGLLTMHWLTLVVVFVSWPAWSDGPSPGPSKPAAKPQATCTNPNKISCVGNSASFQTISTVENAPSLKHHEISKNESQDGHNYSSSEWWLVYLTGFLSLVTAALAAYTAKLWRATVGLVDDGKVTSKRQAGDTQRAYALAEKQMVLTARQVDLAEKQHGLEQWQYLTTHRPKLIIRKISLHEGTEGVSTTIGGCTTIQFDIANVGGSRATILESNATFARVDGILPVIPPYSTATNTVANTVREAGQSDPPEALFIEDTETLQVIRDWQGKTVTNGEQCPYFFIGYIQYSDSMDTVRRMAFCRRYNPATKRFVHVDDPEYEYAD